MIETSKPKKCNSVLDSVYVCVHCSESSPNFSLFTLLFLYLLPLLSSFFTFHHSQSKKKAQTSYTNAKHTHNKRREAKRREKKRKRNRRQKEAICCCFFHLRLRFIVFKYSKNGRWVRTKRGVSNVVHDVLQAVA